MVSAEVLEKPLPKPKKDLIGYASARVLEALAEALLAIEFLEKGYTRNAAGKAFQAWRALTASILALERDKILDVLKRAEERSWLAEKGLTRISSTRLKYLGQLVDRIGYENYAPYTNTALDLHDYQYHGPDPEAELSKYTRREEAVYDIIYLLNRLAKIVREKLRPALRGKDAWTDTHEEILKKLEERLARQL
jgi:hypothetical protein